ncbi:uncharacterized protein LOC8060505 [Sorghum bicolor]|uniref:DUF7798 domain-containing protein n=2 Tax=Sorghum bicolor TaxID=4558 RepID=A0A1B6QI64_SORBI|nr:uncharacterized protein LOC8060505 [Sorghum bicolor]KXG37605.1 hypothetical protein SORBI_3001G097500 [Sorghum bicolor]|eukprot:XP_002463907.2 uncharacterized protein LOC8060505 [Sorghum bicolor]
MSDESPPPPAPPAQADEKSQPAEQAAGSWGGWGLSIFSEISRSAVEVAKSAIADIQQPPEQETGPGTGSGEKDQEKEPEGEGEEEERRKAALDKLEKASEDSILGQGLKAFDSSVETITTGTWQALGTAWKSGSLFVQKLENSASSLAETIQQGELPAKASAIAPTILETGKSFTAKGMEVLERVGKETMDFIVEETGMEVDKGNNGEGDQQTEEEQFEEASFDRCFYIYGGPDQLEELEALSSHYALLFNRKKGKLNTEQKTLYDGKLKEIQQIFSLSTNVDEDGPESDKGKKIESANTDADAEMKKLCESSVSKAAKMAAGFTTALGGLSPNEIIKRTTNRLETIHSEGVHRLSEMCCLAVSQLLVLGKSVISSANKSKSEDDENDVKIDWPEDPISKAKIIRWKVQSISVDMEKVSTSFATGISDVAEAYAAAMQSALAGKQDDLPNQKSLQEKVKSISIHLNSDQTSAVSKLQDALQYLAYVVVCASMPSV